MSAVPRITWTATGPIAPSESDIFAGVAADINAAFGITLNPNLETPQGQLASSLTATIGDCYDKIIWLFNQMNPDVNDGVYQESIGRIYYINRRPATSTTVICTCSGAYGIAIPSGHLIKDSSGNTYTAVTGGIILSGGAINLQYKNILTGPIPALAGSVTIIQKTVLGLDSVINAADGILGENAESRAEFEFRRKESVALNGRGSLGTIYANVFAVPDVTDIYAYENNTNTIQVVGSSSFHVAPHSIYLAVQGGADSAVGQAIWKSKDVGADYNGNTTVTITDTENYAYPYPTYTVKFQRPAQVAVKIAVSIVDSPAVPVDAVANIKTAITSAEPSRIGQEVVAGQFFAAVQGVSPYIQILSILIGKSTPTGTAVSVGIDEVATFSASDITVIRV